MMKVHICPSCGFYAITSRRTQCECRACSIEMTKSSIPIEDWWSFNQEERGRYIRRLLENQKKK